MKSKNFIIAAVAALGAIICLAFGVRTVAGHDFGRERFGVTQAVRDVVGEPDEVVGTCWLKRVGG